MFNCIIKDRIVELPRYQHLQPRLQLLQRITQRVVAPCNATAHLVDIRLRRSLGFDRRVVIESRRFHDFFIRQLAVALAIGPLVHVDDYGASKSQVVLECHVAVDETVISPAAQLPGEFGALS